MPIRRGLRDGDHHEVTVFTVIPLSRDPSYGRSTVTAVTDLISAVLTGESLELECRLRDSCGYGVTRCA
jgi:hypothetical protein